MALRLCAPVLFVLLLPTDAIQADVIRLRDGKTISGVIVSQTRDHIMVRFPGGRVRRLEKSRITQIQYQVAEVTAAERRQIDQEVARALEKRRATLVTRLRAEIADLKRLVAAAEKAGARGEKQPANAPKKQRGRASLDGSTGPSELTIDRHSLWRSAIVPGWGQWHRGQRSRGAVFLGGFTVALGFAYEARTRYRSALRDYERLPAVSPFFALWGTSAARSTLPGRVAA